MPPLVGDGAGGRWGTPSTTVRRVHCPIAPRGTRLENPSTIRRGLVAAIALAVAASWCGGSTGATSLPAPLTDLEFRVQGVPTDDLVLIDLIAAKSPGALVVFDTSGNLRWYKLFDEPNAVVEASQLPSGNFLAYVGPVSDVPSSAGRYVEIAPSGAVVRTLRAAPPLSTDPHDALVTDEGTPQERIHLFGYDVRTVDLAPLGRSGTASVAGHSIQRLLATGEPEFTWSAWDHIGLDEWIDPVVPGVYAGSDFDHPNSLAMDASGNYVVSFRNLDSVLLVDSHSGEVLWRLGGKRNEFTFLDDPLNGFSGQHDVRVLPGGHLLVFDNGSLHQPPTTRVVEYALDVTARTARLVWQFSRPGVFNAITGSAVRDSGGMTWVGYSLHGIVDRVAPDGSIAWEGSLTRAGRPTPFYRAVPIRSLDRYLPP